MSRGTFKFPSTTSARRTRARKEGIIREGNDGAKLREKPHSCVGEVINSAFAYEQNDIFVFTQRSARATLAIHSSRSEGCSLRIQDKLSIAIVLGSSFGEALRNCGLKLASGRKTTGIRYDAVTTSYGGNVS